MSDKRCKCRSDRQNIEGSDDQPITVTFKISLLSGSCFLWGVDLRRTAKEDTDVLALWRNSPEGGVSHHSAPSDE
jgi:hypothetical protein